MRAIDRVATTLVDHRHVLVPVLLVAVLLVGAGVTALEEDDTLEAFEIGTEEEAKLDYVESNFATGPANETVAQVVIRDEDVLDRETLLTSLAVQREIRTNETVAPTLADDRPTVGVANLVARAVLRHRRPGVTDPGIERQMAVLASMDQRDIDAVVRRLLAGDGLGVDALALMPTDYERGSTDASATMVVVFQSADAPSSTGNAPDAIVTSQLAIQDIATEPESGEDASGTGGAGTSESGGSGEAVLVVGNGIITDEQQRSREDTLAVLGPLALVFVLGTLVAVYRDPFDVGLSLVGIALVQFWTFGALGWVGIAFNPVLIAVPVLLVGLSIDYGIHVFMRYRERRAGGDATASAMRTALSGVGVALLWVTVTTVVGFLSNLASPVGPVRELGVIAAVGIVGALVVFGLVLPPLKVTLDGALERVGVPRRQHPVGTGGGVTAGVLSVGSRAARRAPVAVVVLVLVLTALTTAGATQVSTSFEPEDNIADGAPGWTETLPEGMQPDEYTVRENLRYVNERFGRPDSRVEILVEGDVTDPETVEGFDRAATAAADREVTVRLASGEARTESPATVMVRVAAENERFDETLTAADTDGDGLPDRDLESVYDELYAVAPEQAASVLLREDGEYVAARMSVAVDPAADGEATTGQMRAVGEALDGDGRTVTVTGEPVVSQQVQDHLLGTLLTSFAVTVLVVGALLALVYRIVHDSATLGLVTLLPVVLVVSWIVGTMTLLGYPLSVLTTIVASITVGIGIDYCIHVSERFREELAGGAGVDDAIATTTRGTGSALLGSAVTTAIGFGVLGFAFFPVLQQFGTITAVMVVYAFLASVLVLPSLLVLWARYAGVGPDDRPSVDNSRSAQQGEPVDD